MDRMLILMALAFAVPAFSACAQDDGPPPGPPPGEGGGPGGQKGEGRRPRPHPIVAALDANRDGVIDEQEIANAPEALKKLDRNGDGKITMDELRPPPPGGPEGGGTKDGGAKGAGRKGGGKKQGPPPDDGAGPGGTKDGGRRAPPPSPLHAALDANGDGVIDEQEIANAPAALKTCDKNGDGKLTPDEFLPPRPGGSGGRGGPGGPGGAGPGGPGGGPEGPPPGAGAGQ